MTNISILEVDISKVADAFARYSAMFDKYSAQLAKHPALAKLVTKEFGAGTQQLDKMSAIIDRHNGQLRQMSEAYRIQNRQLTQSDKLWENIGKTVRGISSSILGTTKWLISWTGILGAVGGLFGAGGLWGIDRMARNAADSRRSAMGLGLSIGEQRAFQINFGRAVDPDAFLSWVSQMEMDPTKRGPAQSMGVGMTRHTGADAVSMLRAIRARGQSMDPSMIGMLPQMFGLEGVSGEDVRRLVSMSNTEFEGLTSGYQKDANRLNIPDRTAEAWTDFIKRMDEAKSHIFATFVRGLVPLEPSLAKLSVSFEHLLDRFMHSDVLQHSIDNLSTWLDELSKKIDSPEFQQNVSNFITSIGDMVDALGDAIQDIQHPSNIWNKLVHPDDYWSKQSQRSVSAYLARLDESYSLPKGTTEGIWKAETNKSWNPNIKSPTGALGPFQFTKAAASDFHVDPSSWSSSAAGTAAQIAYLANQRYNGDIQAAIASRMGVGSKTVNDPIYQMFSPMLDPRKPWTTALGLAQKAHPNDWQQYLTPGEKKYMQTVEGVVHPRVDIHVYNHTGSDITVNTSALAVQ
jgi:hypothetical protein